MENNETLNNIYSRRSVREYSNKEIPQSVIDSLMKAGLSAPSNVNKMPWEFVVVDDKKILERLANATLYAKMTKDAPLAILVCGNMERTLPGEGKDSWVEDCSAASENILIAAQSLNLGAVWTGVYPTHDRVRNVSKAAYLPEHIIPLSLIVLGYPKNLTFEEKELPTNRVHYNGF
ncbi:MAG: nitroreductase family protein [Sphaerochaetaceae bacterium]|nr:nitroreductase family protein [Sphaerochaetaceae bacterium]